MILQIGPGAFAVRCDLCRGRKGSGLLQFCVAYHVFVSTEGGCCLVFPVPAKQTVNRRKS